VYPDGSSKESGDKEAGSKETRSKEGSGKEEIIFRKRNNFWIKYLFYLSLVFLRCCATRCLCRV
jgi:hypothetical protein